MSRYVTAEGGKYPLFYSQLVPNEFGKWVYPDDLGPGVIAQAVLAMPTFRTRIIPDDAEHLQTRRVQIIVGGSYFDANSTGTQLLERLRRAIHPDGQPVLYLASRSAESALVPESMPKLKRVRKKRASLQDSSQTDPWIQQQLPITTQISITLVEAGLIPPPEDVAKAMSRLGVESLKRLLSIDPHRLETLASGGFSSSLQQEYQDLSLLLNSISGLALE